MWSAIRDTGVVPSDTSVGVWFNHASVRPTMRGGLPPHCSAAIA
jgi:hypothetical protein